MPAVSPPLTRQVVTVAVTVLLVSSVATVGTAAAQSRSGDATAPPGTADEPTVDLANRTADHVYRYANGSAVLVYESDPAGGDVTTAQFGADVSTALVNAVVVSEYDNQMGATGRFGVRVTRDSLRGTGTLAFDAPDDLERLDAAVTGAFTPNRSTAEATLDMTLRDAADVPTADTTGEVVVGPDSFRANATYAVASSTARRQPSNRTYALTETDTGYRIDFDVDRPVNQFVESRWNTSEKARRTIRTTYEGLADEYGGSVELTVDSYEYTERPAPDRQDRLDIEYTVTLVGVEAGVAERVTDQLATSAPDEFTDAEREQLESSLEGVTVERATLALNRSASGTSGSASVAVTGYQDPFLDYLGAAASDGGVVEESQVAKLRKQLAARDAADLRQTVGWSVTVAEGTSGSVDVRARVTYDTDNWGAYTDELADRGVPFRTDVVFDGTAQLRDGAVETNLTFQVRRERLVDSALSELSDLANRSASEDGTAVEAFRALDDAKLRVARADLVLGDDRVEVRAAAQFENLSEFRRLADGLPDDTPVIHAYSEQSGDATTTYVYVEDLDMSASELRESPLADDETVIHAPGEWERTFPNMDIGATAEYLGVDVAVNNPPNSGTGGATTATPSPTATATATPSPTPTDTARPDTPPPTAADGPGFGLAAGLVALALLAGALVALRRDG